MFNNVFFPKIVPFVRKMWKNIVKPDRPQMAIWRMRFPCRITKLKIQTHAQYLILIAFPQQQWLRERNIVVRYTFPLWFVALLVV